MKHVRTLLQLRIADTVPNMPCTHIDVWSGISEEGEDQGKVSYLLRVNDVPQGELFVTGEDEAVVDVLEQMLRNIQRLKGTSEK